MSMSVYAVAPVALGVSGVAVAVCGHQELRRRWASWAVIAPAVLLPLWLGPAGAALLAAALGAVAAREYAALARLPRPDRWLLAAAAVGGPAAALLAPGLLSAAPLLALAAALAPLLQGDTADGSRRTAYTAFGVLWIGWGLAHLVLLDELALPVVLAVAVADVAAWCAGRSLRRFRWAAARLTAVSPAKTRGGVLGAAAGAGAALAVTGQLHPGLLLAVGLGAVLGDLVESLLKRHAGVKDAGSWLPGFGGLLDRVDSLLLTLPLAWVLS
ncbi:phosphatidate cytidylyltransferase [Motilibacter deserti]|uniref:Phosphatidate cytidylyltransferase n=1 Tax=Motilibacter deserti TaxID=2714956 RepID=A0ABX0GUM7_9ACTN|nr:phosphatidate cytidylyltransferase [Motilibacter deserti]NHC14260.1 phosphatidate cytidylyltransferase [Motilibacter deserti]